MLQVFYSNSQVGSLEGENVRFEVVGSAQGASLSSNDQLTDAQGFAAVTLQPRSRRRCSPSRSRSPPPRWSRWSSRSAHDNRA